MKPRAPWAQLPAGALLTTGDVARALRVSPRQVRAWATTGELVGEETWGGQWVFRKRDVVVYWAATGGRMAWRGAAAGQLALPIARRGESRDPDPEAKRRRNARVSRYVA